MSFLEGLLTSARSVINDISRREDAAENDVASVDDPLAPIHEGFDEEEDDEETSSGKPRTIEQIESMILKTKQEFKDLRNAGAQTTTDQKEEIRTLKAEMQQWESKLKKRQRETYDTPYEDYSEYVQSAFEEGTPEPPGLEDTDTSNAGTSGATLSESMQRRLGTMLEKQLLKHLHLLMMAEKQLQIQSSIWNDIVLTLHEKPGSLDEGFMGTKIRILTEISTTEKTKSQLEQKGEEEVRKQVLSMCKLKREVAQEVKKKTSQLEEKVFKNGNEDTPAREILRTLSTDSFGSADLAFEELKDPSRPAPPMPMLRQSSSLKLRLAREKAAARLADSRRRFSVDSTTSVNSDVASLGSIAETGKGDTSSEEGNRISSPSGVRDFPIVQS